MTEGNSGKIKEGGWDEWESCLSSGEDDIVIADARSLSLAVG